MKCTSHKSKGKKKTSNWGSSLNCWILFHPMFINFSCHWSNFYIHLFPSSPPDVLLPLLSWSKKKKKKKKWLPVSLKFHDLAGAFFLLLLLLFPLSLSLSYGSWSFFSPPNERLDGMRAILAFHAWRALLGVPQEIFSSILKSKCSSLLFPGYDTFRYLWNSLRATLAASTQIQCTKN